MSLARLGRSADMLARPPAVIEFYRDDLCPDLRESVAMRSDEERFDDTFLELTGKLAEEWLWAARRGRYQSGGSA